METIADMNLFEIKDNVLVECTPIKVVSKEKDVLDSDIIQIIDESGHEVNCTYNKFVEIFDKEGLAGFIL